jgi:hypothetical protein
MRGKSRHQGRGTLFGKWISMPMMYGEGRHQADAAVTMNTDDTDLWITRSDGLITRSESIISEGRGRTLHASIRYEFNALEAPPSLNR